MMHAGGQRIGVDLLTVLPSWEPLVTWPTLPVRRHQAQRGACGR